MNIIRRVIKNTTVIIFNDAINITFNLFISISLARYFGQVGFGKLSFLAIFLFFISLTDTLWIKPILVRELSKGSNKANTIMGNGLIIKTGVSIIAIILFWISVWVISASKDIMILAFFASINILVSSLISTYIIAFQVALKMIYFVLFNLFNKILVLLLIAILIFLKGNLFQFYLLSLIPSVLLLILTKWYSRKIIAPIYKIEFGIWKKIFRESWPLGLSAIFIFVYHRIDHIILFRLKGADVVGLYSAERE